MPTVKTILYCEDDPIVRHVYKKRLEQEGFHVLYAEDGLEALKCLHKLVLDLMMPKFSGEEVLKFICNEPRLHEVPLVILSTNSEVEEDYAPISGRADKYLVKYHCTPDKLLGVIQEIFNGPVQKTLDDLGDGSDTITFEKIKRLVGGSPAG